LSCTKSLGRTRKEIKFYLVTPCDTRVLRYEKAIMRSTKILEELRDPPRFLIVTPREGCSSADIRVPPAFRDRVFPLIGYRDEMVCDHSASAVAYPAKLPLSFFPAAFIHHHPCRAIAGPSARPSRVARLRFRLHPATWHLRIPSHCASRHIAPQRCCRCVSTAVGFLQRGVEARGHEAYCSASQCLGSGF
jgi:hypothetical protein